MRRIVVIASGPAGVRCATRLKRRLPTDEINLVLPPFPADRSLLDGPVGRRLQTLLPDVEAIASREVGILETTDIMPDLEKKEVTITSSRGQVTVRYTDLIVEVPAHSRIPRQLQKADNVFSWPVTGFASNPETMDKAMMEAVKKGKQIVIIGSGAMALDAMLLAVDASAGKEKSVRWICTDDTDGDGIDQHLRALLINKLGPAITYTPVPEFLADQLQYAMDTDNNLESILLPDGTLIETGCCLWATRLMARHPLLREDGVLLDESGCIHITEGTCDSLCLTLMGSAATLPETTLQQSGAVMTRKPGGLERAFLSGMKVLDTITATQAEFINLGVFKASGHGICLLRAGLTSEEAALQKLETEHAILSMDDGAVKNGTLVLKLIADKKSRTLLGVQTLYLSSESGQDEGYVSVLAAEAMLEIGLNAISAETSLDALLRRETTVPVGRFFSAALSILVNKLAGKIYGISPEEFLASREAGAEFFTLDLRSQPEWKQGHLPGAYNIPLPQLKKRLQNEVPHFTPLVIVAQHSADAYVVACHLASLGATSLYVLDGGMHLWPYAVEKE